MRLDQQTSALDLPPAAANFTNHSFPPRGRGFCGRGGRPFNRGNGYFPNNRGRGSYFSPDGATGSRPTCQICGKIGHTAFRCYHQQESIPDQQHPPSPQAYYSTPALPAEDVWYPDTGATHHVTNELQYLNLSREEYHGQDRIRVGDGTGLPISHVASASFIFSRRKLIVNQLLRVPSISKNLLSVQKFAFDNSVFFEFHSSYFLIKDIQTKAILHQGQTKDGLYPHLPSTSSSSINKPLSMNALLQLHGTSAWVILPFAQFSMFFLNSTFQFLQIRLPPLALHVHKPRVISSHLVLLVLQFVVLYN
jgi:hypothetical protein